MSILRRVAAARRFPFNTCPATRHAQLIGEALVKGKPYLALLEDPKHGGESILTVVAALYEARTRAQEDEAVDAWIAAVLDEAAHGVADGIWIGAE